MKNLWYLTITLFLITSCNLSNNKTLSDKAVITGHVSNFSKISEHDFIDFIYYDLFDGQKKIIKDIDEDGNFSFELDNLDKPTEFYLKYASLLTYCIFPGDSLHFEIDGNCWEGRKKRYEYFTITGSSEKFNRNLAKYNQLISDSLNTRQFFYEESNVIRNSTIEYYKKFETAYIKRKQLLTNKFNSENNVSEQFVEWTTQNVKFTEWNNLFRYTWLHPHYNKFDGKKQYEFKKNIPDSYFAFLDNWDQENKDYLGSITYMQFLHEYKSYKMSLIDHDKINKMYVAESFHPIKDFDKINKLKYPDEKGFVLDLLIAQDFSHLLDANFKLTKKYIILDKIKDTEVRERITAKYNYVESFENDKSLANNLNHENADEFLKALVKKHPNKVIYIDFWATWCGPCIGEMPYSRKVKKKLEGKDVVFVYLANRSGESVWKSTIAKNKIEGDHYLLTDKQFSNLSKVFGITGVPHYALINKEGIIVDKNAPRPRTGDLLVNLIENHISGKELTAIAENKYVKPQNNVVAQTKQPKNVAFTLDNFENNWDVKGLNFEKTENGTLQKNSGGWANVAGAIKKDLELKGDFMIETKLRMVEGVSGYPTAGFFIDGSLDNNDPSLAFCLFGAHNTQSVGIHKSRNITSGGWVGDGYTNTPIEGLSIYNWTILKIEKRGNNVQFYVNGKEHGTPIEFKNLEGNLGLMGESSIAEFEYVDFKRL
ncbi:MAG: TlpA disulfide reductase family protein [Bacteroidota bacterium]